MLVCFFFHVSATTYIYTLSLHDALPILARSADVRWSRPSANEMDSSDDPCAIARMLTPWLPRMPNTRPAVPGCLRNHGDRKSTRLNSSHLGISYAVFCLKKKNIHVTREI